MPIGTLHVHKRSKMPSILVINHSSILFPRLELFFDLTVLDASGKVLYNKIYVKKWSHLEDEVTFLRKHFNLLSLLMEDKEHMSSIIPRAETTLLELFEDFCDLN